MSVARVFAGLAVSAVAVQAVVCVVNATVFRDTLPPRDHFFSNRSGS